MDNNTINMVNGYEDPDGRFRIAMNGMLGTVVTEFGLQVDFDGRWFINVAMPKEMGGSVEGLCRNFNGDIDDEMTVNGYNYNNDTSAFGSLFQTDDPSDAL